MAEIYSVFGGVRIRPVGVALTLLCVPACSGEGATDFDAAEEIASQSSPITSVSQEFFWQQGQPDKFLGDANQWACFLVKVTGKFEGWGESVFIRAVGNPFGTNLFLTGTSQQSGVSAVARCVQRPSLQTTTYTWDQYMGGPVDMGGGGSSRVCALTAVGGRFEAHTEFVRIQRNTQGNWFLDGGSNQHDVWGQATCFPGVTLGGEYTWQSGQAQTPMATNPSVNSRNYCFLTHMGGRFDGASHTIFAYTTPTIENWLLNGGGSNSRQARARCASNNI